ncbi:hypothetical protein IW261DRAFT_1417520 [Armillaria novae-zelandiae]|uniref:Uncharacterized protein n=1 Tax=Armillaria novae-zelandiae TaxID=153914 RepID=A0AA39UI71_9AGAR|nr:hypothetical protein IW261DRAFT_1417520 [Armillaria novae-zelandiae]
MTLAPLMPLRLKWRKGLSTIQDELRSGDGINEWRPSGNQVMKDKLPSIDIDQRDEDVEWDARKKAYQCSRAVRCIDKGYIRGLSMRDPQERRRSGALEVKDARMTPRTFKIVAVHLQPIPNGSYTLLGRERHWVIGRRLRDVYLLEFSTRHPMKGCKKNAKCPIRIRFCGASQP